VIAVLVSLAVPALASASITWTGQGDGSSWSDAANWSPEVVPGASDSAVIPTGLDAHVVVPSSTTVKGLEFDGTNLEGSSVTVTNNFIWDDGAISLTLDSPGTASIGGTTTKQLDGELDLSGSTYVSGSGSLYVLGSLLDNTGTLTLEPGSTVMGNGVAERFVNSGSLVVPPSSSGVATVTGWGDQQGAGFIDKGSVSVGQGSTLDLHNDEGELSTGNTFTGAGTTRVDGGARLWLASGVSIGSGSTLQLGPADSSGTPFWFGSGSFSGSGRLVWSGGYIGGESVSNDTPVTVSVPSTITTDITGPQQSVLAINSNNSTTQYVPEELDLAGPTNLGGTGGLEIGNDTLKSTGAFTIQPGSTFYGNGGTEHFINAGSLVVPASSSGTATLTGMGVQQGAGFIDKGSVSVGQGSTLDLHNDEGELSTGNTFTGAGTTRVDGGARLWLASGVSIGSGSTLQLGPADSSGTPFWFGSGSFSGSGRLVWSGGNIGGGAAAATVGVGSGVSTVISGSGAKTLLEDSNNGSLLETLNLAGPTALSGALGASGDVAIGNSGTLTTGAAMLGSGSGAQLTNTGTLIVAAGASRTSFDGIGFTNHGHVALNSGTLRLDAASTYQQKAGSTQLAGGALTSTPVIQIAAGALSGYGTITGPVTNAGTVDPSTTGGVLKISGAYDQTGTGKLLSDIAGTTAGSAFGQLDVTGAATLAGTIDAVTTGGFSPTSGESFPVLLYGSHTAQFATWSGTSGYKVTYNATAAAVVFGVPWVSGVTPDAGQTSGGNTVTIRGGNLAAGDHVLFGSTPATSVTFVSSGQLTAVAPAHSSGVVGVTVGNSIGASRLSNSDLYAYGPPTVGSLSPSSGITGSSVTVSGTNFVPRAVVKFAGLASPTVTYVSPTALKAVVPNGASSGNVGVTTAAGAASSPTSYTVTLSVTGFTPTSGPAGTVVKISGVGFNSTSTVSFGGATATTVDHVSSTELDATVPSGASTGPITVTNTATPTGIVKSHPSYTVN
jgi:hypothetical protein